MTLAPLLYVTSKEPTKSNPAVKPVNSNVPVGAPSVIADVVTPAGSPVTVTEVTTVSSKLSSPVGISNEYVAVPETDELASNSAEIISGALASSLGSVSKEAISATIGVADVEPLQVTVTFQSL